MFTNNVEGANRPIKDALRWPSDRSKKTAAIIRALARTGAHLRNVHKLFVIAVDQLRNASILSCND
jgi:hypothetical protein